MTAVLADLVGPHGRVVGVDVAPPYYGTPVTVGQSARHLLDGPLGDRIDMRYETDVLTDNVCTGYDLVVLAHCSWYFASTDLLAVLAQDRNRAGAGAGRSGEGTAPPDLTRDRQRPLPAYVLTAHQCFSDPCSRQPGLRRPVRCPRSGTGPSR